MRRPLKPRERHYVSLIVLALVICSAYWFIDTWFSGPLREINEQIERLRIQQQGYAAALLQRASIREQLQRLRQDPISNTNLLPGEDANVATAYLMQHIADVVASHAFTGAGCDIVQRLPIVPELVLSEPYRQVKVSVILNCAIEPLMAVLYDLEYKRPFLFIEEMSLRRSSAAPLQGGAGKLVSRLLVRGYLQRERVGQGTPDVRTVP